MTAVAATTTSSTGLHGDVSLGLRIIQISLNLAFGPATHFAFTYLMTVAAGAMQLLILRNLLVCRTQFLHTCNDYNSFQWNKPETAGKARFNWVVQLQQNLLVQF